MQTFHARHDMLLMKAKQMLEKAQFRVVIVGNGRGRTPDLVGLKDGRLYQIEIESEKRSHRNLMGRVDRQYDSAIFFTKAPQSSGQMRIVETIETASLPAEQAVAEAIEVPVSKVSLEPIAEVPSHRVRMNETELGHVRKGLSLLKGAKIEGLDEKLVDSLIERFRRSRPGGRNYRGDSS